MKLDHEAELAKLKSGIDEFRLHALEAMYGQMLERLEMQDRLLEDSVRLLEAVIPGEKK